MKKLILLVCMLWGIAQAQTTGYFRYDTVRFEKVGGNSEFVLRNATRNVVGGVLTNMGNGRTAFLVPSPGVIVNLPLYLDGDTAITLNQADANNDGYLSAGDWARMDSAVRRWKDSVIASAPVITNYVEKPVLLKGYYMPPSSYGHTISGNVVYPNYMASLGSQSVAIGSRGAAARYKDGTATGDQNVFIGEYSGHAISTGILNTAIGKASGYNLSTGSRNTLIGAHTIGVSTGDGNVQLGYIGTSFTAYTGSYNTSLGSGMQPSGVSATTELNLGANGVPWITGRTNGAVIAFPQMALATSDSSKSAATTEWVKQQAYGAGGGSSAPSIISISSSTTLTEPSFAYDIVEVDASGGSVTLTLPAITAGKSFIIKKIDTSVNAVNFTTDEGAQSITTQWAGAEVYRRSSSYGISRIF